MEQPEELKYFRERWEKPINNIYAGSYQSLESLRESALKAIREYKEVKKGIEDDNKRRENILNYFKYIDDLENKK